MGKMLFDGRKMLFHQFILITDKLIKYTFNILNSRSEHKIQCDSGFYISD